MAGSDFSVSAYVSMLDIGRATEAGGLVIITTPKAAPAISTAAPNDKIVFISIPDGFNSYDEHYRINKIFAKLFMLFRQLAKTENIAQILGGGRQ